MQGTQCVSNFNFQTQTVLNANTTFFNQNYLSFLNSVANAAGVTLTSVTVLSINYGSVTVTMLVSTENSPGSSQAIDQQNNLQTTLSKSVAGMPVVSNSVTTNGGSNNNSDNNSGLSETTIIILATVIPVGTLRIFYVI
jgi:hypothetical protein